MKENLTTAEEFASDESFIAYYLRSEETAVIFWEKWISTHPEKIDEILTAERMLDLLHLHLHPEEIVEERKRLTDFISSRSAVEDNAAPFPNNTLLLPNGKATVQNYIEDSPQAIRRLYPQNIIRIAAAVLIVAATAILFINPAKWFGQPQKQASWTNYTSPVNQRSTIRLSDGSKVTLNAGSTLSYPNSFKDKNRSVKLSGQAFFEVTHDSAHPFIVSTGNIRTQVLGTSFNVSGDTGSREISVALLKGSVNISLVNQPHKSMLLKPGEKMTYATRSGEMSKATFDAVAEAGWKDGVLQFKHADFSTIAAAFQKNYGYTLVNNSSSRNFSYNGTFTNEHPIKVIQAICYSMHMSYTIDHTTITLIPSN